MMPNEVAGKATSSPENVKKDMKNLILSYNKKEKHTFDEILVYLDRIKLK